MGGQAVVSPVIKSVEVAVPATPVATVPTVSVGAPQEQLSEPLLSTATPAPVVEKENTVVEPTPSMLEPKSQESKRQVSWVRVGSASALAAVGVGTALLMGVPQYNAMTIAENDYIRAATEDPQTLKPLSSRLSLKLNKQATWRDLFIGSGVVRWLRQGRCLCRLGLLERTVGYRRKRRGDTMNQRFVYVWTLVVLLGCPQDPNTYDEACERDEYVTDGRCESCYDPDRSVQGTNEPGDWRYDGDTQCDYDIEKDIVGRHTSGGSDLYR